MVFAQGKQIEHLVAIVRELVGTGQNVLCTRVSAEQAQAVQAAVPAASYHALSRLLFVRQHDIVRAAWDASSWPVPEPPICPSLKRRP